MHQIFCKLDSLQKGRISLWAGHRREAINFFRPAVEKISQVENHSNIDIERRYYEYLEDMYQCVCTPSLREKIILCKLYIALHYYTPYIAIEQCQWARKQIAKSSSLKRRNDLNWMLKEHEAHSYLNSGQLKRADTSLQELLAVTIYSPDCVDKQTLFDLYDKLANLNIKYNNASVAEKYILLAEETALHLKDRKLEALAYITHAKLYFYENPEKAQQLMKRADECLQGSNLRRIALHNDITKLILILKQINLTSSALDDMKQQAKKILDECVEKQFANSVIRSNLVLGTLYFLSDKNISKNPISLYYLNQGIDASLRFGIGTYIWEIYTLLALISIRQHQPLDYTARLFETVFQQLRRQNLLHARSSDFCYGNLLAISNIAKFYAIHKFESEFYQKMALISYMEFTEACDYNCGKNDCNYICEQSTKQLKAELKRFQHTRKGKPPILFQKKIPIATLWDEETGYYLILS